MKICIPCISPIPLISLIASLSFLLPSCAEIKPVTMGGVETPNVKQLSREGIEVDFGMRIMNPNKMGITVYPSTFEATINDIPVGKVRLVKKVRIKGNSDDAPQFTIKSDFSKLSLSDLTKVMAIVASKSGTIYLKGDIKVGKWYYKKKFPIEFKKTISLSK